MHKYIYSRWSDSSHWIWHHKRHLITFPDWMQKEFSHRSNLVFADVANDLLKLYAQYITPEAISKDQDLSHHYFVLAKAYNELTQFDFLLLKLSYGENTHYLEFAYSKELTKDLRAMRKTLDRYLLGRSPRIRDIVLAKLEKIDRKLKQAGSESVTLQALVTEFDRVYDELLIANMIEQM
jgi:hypothetical protein